MDSLLRCTNEKGLDLNRDRVKLDFEVAGMKVRELFPTDCNDNMLPIPLGPKLILKNLSYNVHVIQCFSEIKLKMCLFYFV